MEYKQSLEIIHHSIDNWLYAFVAFIPNFIMAILVISICYFFTRIVRRKAEHIFTKHFPNQRPYLSFVTTIVTVVFWFFGIFLALNILGLTSLLTHLLAGAGIIGIVAGFALNDVSSNAFAGLLIRSQKPFVVGDWIKIDDYFGVVDKIGLVVTNIKTYQGHLAYVPNQLMFSGAFLNYSTYGKAKIITSIGVSYGDDLEHVEKVALTAIRDLPMIIEPETMDFYFTDVGASTYNFVIRFHIKFTQHIDMLNAQSETIKRLKAAFEKENISVAYNVMTLDFGVKGGVNLYDKPVEVKINE